MPMHLRVVGGPDQGRQFPLPPAGSVLIGTSHKSADICLRDIRVARLHCELAFAGGQATLAEVADADGTFVNDVRVTRRGLQPGDVIRIGGTRLCYAPERGDAADASDFEEIANEAANDRQLVCAGMPADAGPILVPHDGQAARLGGLPAVDRGRIDKVWLDELPGKHLAHYDIGRLLAKSRSGMVFRARDRRDETDVALKVLHPEFPRDDREMERFLRATRTVLPLRHPNLVRLYAAGRSASQGVCWMALEYVRGESLAKQLPASDNADWKPALRVAAHIARALTHAEQHEIVHRNVTPQNILIRCRDGVAKLGDLMLAKALKGALARRITQAGELLGDVPYMSPERTIGIRGVDCRSDLYSLGATVYHMLVGRPPFQGQTSTETMHLIRSAELVKPSEWQRTLPIRFERIVLRMLARRPADRPQSARELVDELDGLAREYDLFD